MRQRHKDRCNSGPARVLRKRREEEAKHAQELEALELKRKEEAELERYRPIARALLVNLGVVKTGNVPKDTRPPLKMPPKGAPVPRRLTGRYRRYGFPQCTEPAVLQEAQCIERYLERTSLGRWPGPRAVSSGLVQNKSQLINVWRVRRDPAPFFDICQTIQTYDVEPNIKRLFHGTNCTSLAGIMSQGLVCGSSGMFGGGIYLAPNFSKSWGFAGGEKFRFMLAVDAALGNVLSAPKAQNYGPRIWKEGFHSVGGSAGVTQTYGSSTLRYSEYVVYYPQQVRVLYLAQFEDQIG